LHLTGGVMQRLLATPRPPIKSKGASTGADLWFHCAPCNGRVPARGFRTEEGRLLLTCSRCGIDTAASGPESGPGRSRDAVWVTDDGELVFPNDETVAPRRLVDPYSPVAGHCVRCIAPARTGVSCSSCGSLYSLPPPANVLPSLHLRRSWQKLVAHWEDPAGHARAMELAQSRSELGALGRLYRIWLTYFPDDATAVHGRDEVVRLASIPIIVATTVQKPAVGRRGRALGPAAVILTTLAVGVLTLLAMSRRSASTHDAGPTVRVLNPGSNVSWSPGP
jgi:hypothetical protein